MTGLSAAAHIMRRTWQHPSNDGRRLRALGGAVNRQLRLRLSRTHRIHLAMEGIEVSLGRGEYGMSSVLYAWPPFPAEMNFWRRSLAEGDLFIDVGANAGLYSLFAGSLGARVIALEPSSDSFSALERNIALNDSDITGLRKAVGETPGRFALTVGRDAMNSLAATAGADFEMVDVVTLDDVIGDQTVAGMKIDIEGFEYQALRGAERALRSHRIRAIQMEWNDLSLRNSGVSRIRIAEYLRGHGYSLHRPDLNGALQPVVDEAAETVEDMVAVAPEIAPA